MPTYDYYCKHCDSDIEIFHAMSAPAVQVCPSCKKRGLKRRIGAGAGLIFKGGGFYETDYRRTQSQTAPEKGTSGGNPSTAAPAKEKTTKEPSKASVT